MKQINDLWFFGTVITLLIMILLFNRCEKEKQYICSDVFTPETVIINGEEAVIYHKELVCEEYYY